MRLRKKLLTMVMIVAMLITTMPLQAMAGESGTAVPEKVFSSQWNETYDVFYHAAGENYNNATFTSENVLAVGGSSYNIKNKPTAITTVVDGSTVTISFTNVTRPIGQISDEWNSIEQGQVCIKYNSDIPGKSVVYSGNSNLQTLVLTDVPEGTYSLTNGVIVEKANESSPGTDLGNGLVTEREFGSLPNITVTVAKESPEDESETAKDKDKDVTNKENLVSNKKAPLKTLGASLGKVKVIVENTTSPASDDVAWDGRLVEMWVDIYAESTLASCFLDALAQTDSGYTQSGAETNYITSINGLVGEFSEGSGWMVTVNDWFADVGIDGFTVANENLQDGDLIKIMYSSSNGDLGGLYGNNDKTLDDIESSIGSLTPEFNKDTHEYELVVPTGTEKVKITPTATNKNFLVKSFVGDKPYKRTQEIPVVDGTEIKVICGDPSWPSMNGGAYGSGADSVPAETYTVTVKEIIGKAKVIVENTTFPEANGADWDGQLVEKWVNIYADSTIASCFIDALAQTDSGFTQSGAESNYIGSINGLGAFEGGSASGWMVTLNDWFINEGVGGFTAASGNLQDGDLIKIMYTSNGYGADLGSSWENNDKTVKELKSSIGSLKPEFNKDTHEYQLVVPFGTDKVKITPTATNKNFLVKSFVGDKPYKRTQEIPVVDGTEIKVICGDPSWPSMNGGAYGSGADSVPAETYTVTVVKNHTPTIKSGVENDAVTRILKGTEYNVDLSDIFEDVEDEALTYKVSVDSGEYIPADSKYSYDVDSFGDVDLRFIANDGIEDSVEYHVTLKPVSEEGVSKLGTLLVHVGGSINDSTVLLKNTSQSYATTNVFNSSTIEYDLGVIGDNDATLRLQAKPEEKGATVTLKCNGKEKDVTYTSGSSKWLSCLKAGKNIAELVVTPPATSEKLPRTYKLIIVCEPSLTDLTVDAGKPVYWDSAFKTNDKEYTITLDEDVSILNFDATPRHEEYAVEYNGGDNVLNASGIGKVDVKVSVGEGEDLVSNTYVVNLNKVPSFNCNFNVNIKDAVISVFDPEGASVNPNKDSIYKGLFSDMTYTYVVSKHGYISAIGEIPAGGGEIIATLEKAATGLPEVDSQWKNFRGDDSNMAIVDVKTPIDKEKTALLWNKKLGSGWSASPSIHIIVDNALIVLSGKKIYKLDLETGEVLAEGDMVGSPGFGYTPSTYAEGMIFVPLQDSTIQAFNAKTLESLWIYKDPIKGGQSLSPITYSDGYIYTGFWVKPGADANHVCLSVTDENPTRTDEIKAPTWRRTQKGGFYWAGSVNIGGFNIVGGDGDGPDAEEFDNVVTSMNSKTGEVVSQLNISGAQRSSIAYDKGKGKIYFTTKVGNLYSADINDKTGVLSNLIGKELPGSKQSTSTPVVYKDRVYVGLGGGFSNPGKIVTLDAATLDVLYSVDVKGYPQCSVLLSTAYEKETGYIYLYTTYNTKPGGIQMIKTKADATSADEAEVIDIFDAEGFEQHCIASIICSENGTLYYKNDTGNVFAVGTPKTQRVIDLIDQIKEPITIDLDTTIDTARKAYETLSEDNKANVTNYSKLKAAETALSKLQLQIDGTVKAINAIGKVNKNSKPAIDKARNVYNKLDKSLQKRVTNYQTLLSAEAKLADELAAGKIETLIDGIKKPITLKSEKSIVAARKAYDGLSKKEKACVSNYSKLTAAERAFAEAERVVEEADSNSKPGTGGTTKSLGNAKVKVTVDGVQYDVSERVAEVINGINDMPKDDSATEETVVKRYKAYDTLTKAEKAKVVNYEDLEAAMTRIAVVNHKDPATGIELLDAKWNVKLLASPVNNGEAAYEELDTYLDGKNILRTFKIYLVDILTGEEYGYEDSIKFSVPVEGIRDVIQLSVSAEDIEDASEFSIACYKENGEVELLEAKVENERITWESNESGYYAVVEDVLAEQAPKSPAQDNSVLPWIVVMGIAAAAALATLFLRRRKIK